jgi:hypothetical protein
VEHVYEYPSVRWLPAGAKTTTDAAGDRPGTAPASPNQRELVEASLRIRPYAAGGARDSRRHGR